MEYNRYVSFENQPRLYSILIIGSPDNITLSHQPTLLLDDIYNHQMIYPIKCFVHQDLQNSTLDCNLFVFYYY